MKLFFNLSITKSLFCFSHKTRFSRYLFLLILYATVLPPAAKCQNYEMPAFILSKQANSAVILYKLNSITNTWEVVGNTGKFNIKSLAIDSGNEIIYVVDGGKLGSLNPSTSEFVLIGEIGYAFGENGQVTIDKVYGLAFDSNRNVLYATHRMSGFDILFQINPATGKIVSNSMVNSKGEQADYKAIEIKTFYFGTVYNSDEIIDITYDNERKVLFIAHNYYSNLHGINSYYNIDEMKPKEDYRINPIQNLAGIAFDNDSKFVASFSNNKISEGDAFSGGGVTFDAGILTTIYPNVSIGTIFYGLDFYTIQPCSNEFSLNNSPISNMPKMAMSTINSSAVINVDTEFVAGKSVNLNNNFEVQKLSNFKINIDGNVCK